MYYNYITVFDAGHTTHKGTAVSTWMRRWVVSDEIDELIYTYLSRYLYYMCLIYSCNYKHC